jgi:hypothetical protein
MVQGKSKKVNGKQINVDRAQWICVPNTHEAIICPDVFNRVQMLFTAARERAMLIPKKPYSENILKGKVLCATCGYLMKRKLQNKDGTYWYRCESQQKYGKQACSVVSVKEHELKTQILTVLYKQAEAILGRYIISERKFKTSDDVDSDLREINKGLDKDGRMLRSLYENLVSGLITQREFVEMKVDYESKIAALSKQADEIRNRESEAKAKAAECRDVAEAVAIALSDNLLTSEIVGRLVRDIKVLPNKTFEVVFNFSDEFAEVRHAS